jgi:hypothetical protein
LEDVGVDGRIILKWILNKQCVDVAWIYLAQSRVLWWALVNLRVPQKTGDVFIG